MVKVENLRVGNWVLDNKNEGKVQINAAAFSVMEEGKRTFDPIPLSTELLIMAGFEQAQRASTSDAIIAFEKDGLTILGAVKEAGYSLAKHFVALHDGQEIPLQALHELQNLYYSISGKELQFEL